jgi:hypothetical protein
VSMHMLTRKVWIGELVEAWNQKHRQVCMHMLTRKLHVTEVMIEVWEGAGICACICDP